jgi:hypothetical protein
VTPDFGTVHAAVHVPGPGVNNRGVYRSAATAQPLPLAAVTCPTDPGCQTDSDQGWAHIMARYTGKSQS